MAAETLRDQPDRLLVERFLGGRDVSAFEALVRRHGPMVYRVCWRVLQQEQDTEDCFQATFLVLAQRLRSVRKHASLASWLHGVAHRVALKARARAATRRRHEQNAAADKVLPDDVTWRELRAALDAELGRLPDHHRSPLILCYLEGRTQDEAARQLGWSQRTLRRRLAEGRAALGRRLRDGGLVPTAALSAVLLSDCVAPAALAPGLVGSTVEAACPAFGAACPAGVAALPRGVLQTMFTSRLKFATAVLVVLALSGAGVLTLNRSKAAPDSQPRTASQETAAPRTRGPKDAPPKPAVGRPEAAIAKALDAADRMTYKQLQARLLADLAAAQAALGDKAAAKKTFEKAFDLVGTFDEVIDRSIVLNALAGAQWRAGQPDAARETFEKAVAAVKTLDDPDQVKHQILGVALAQQECGDFKGAWKTWEDNELGKEKDFAAAGHYLRARTAAAQARAGDLKAARETLAAIDAGAAVPFKQEAVAELAEGLLKGGDRKAAEELLGKALDEAAGLPDKYGAPEKEDTSFPRPAALARLALVQARLGDKDGAARSVEQALKVLADHKPTTDVATANKVGGLAQVAAAQADLGDRDGAGKTIKLALETVKDVGEVDRTRVDPTMMVELIVRAQVKAHDWAGATKTLQPLTWEKANVVEELAYAMTLAGEVNRAAELPGEKDAPVVRARAFLGIARGLADLKAKEKP
jgi:RNA polymerase sigma factor (sigma-70 family)